MKIISNDLSCGMERWDDPGDYPNNCAGAPLPSYYYCAFDGSFIFEAETDAEQAKLADIDNCDDWVHEWVLKECSIERSCGITIHCAVEDNRCTVTITEAEYDGPQGPEDY